MSQSKGFAAGERAYYSGASRPTGGDALRGWQKAERMCRDYQQEALNGYISEGKKREVNSDKQITGRRGRSR